MENLSRSEQKRRLHRLEALAAQLVDLPAAKIDGLGCDAEVVAQLREARGLKAGARKRQIKYIAKLLRQRPTEDLFAAVAVLQGTNRQRTEAFHELEYLRNRLIIEALGEFREADHSSVEIDESRPLDAVAAVLARFPELDPELLVKLARLQVRTGKRKYGREIFRLLQAAQERRRFASTTSPKG